MITEPTPSIDTLLASLQGSATSAEGEATRDAFAQAVSEVFAKGSMAAPLPASVPMHNAVNGTNGTEQQRSPSFASSAPIPPPNLLPNGHAASRPASSASASSASRAPMAASSQAGSPVQPPPFAPPGQSKSPPIQQNPLNNQVAPQSQPPNQSPDLQHAPNSTPAQLPAQPAQQASPLVNQSPNVEGSNQYQQLSNLIAEAPASAVRQVIRDKWEKALMGSQYHIAFLLNATMHQASPETLSRAVQEFGQKMVHTSKRELIQHLNPNDFDELVDIILSRVSTQFLDKALARRLETIPARQLVNSLARAERLGYDVQDIVQEQDGEHVIPSLHSLSMPPPSSTLPSNTLPANVPPASSLPIHHYQPQPPPPPPPQPQPHLQSVHQTAPPRAPVNDIPRPPGIQYCSCGWPCSSMEALEHHQKKRACNRVRDSDKAGRDICLHCGCRFGSGGGLLYHEKSNVCGTHTPQTAQMMHGLIAAFRERKQGPPVHSYVPPPPQVGRPPGTQTPSQPTSKPSNWAVSTPSSTPGRDPYAHLTEEKRAKFLEEMNQAEERYGKLMREATLLPEPEKTKQLANLKNSYNTKQSTTRKKYGIRLRERRTKAEIAAEQTRLFGTPEGGATPSHSTPNPESESRPKKRARADTEGHSTTSAMPNGSQESPRRRVPVSEMGGLSGSQATAEMTDPTAFLNPSQPRYVPPKSAGTSRPQSGVAETADHGATQDDPMSIDDDSPADSDSDSGSDDDDIPATLP
ncbi:hypothetical protein FDECE_1701 [Fusarium decemcellulare]|nr:hypothetical protein FDECE_1701 [Fusarium decemcellulare]